nr:hypothetical protein [Tanacetum cinerariifolium]
MSEEFETFKPSCTRNVSSHSLISSDSTTPLLPNHPLTHVSPTPTPTRVSFHRRTARMAVHTQPTLSSGMSARIAEATALSLSSFRKRYRSSYETSSPSSSSTLSVRKRYRCTSELIFDTDSEGDELGEEDTKEDKEDKKEEEEAVLKGQQHAILVVETATSETLELGYGALRCRELAVEEDQVPSILEVGQSFRVYTDVPAYVPLVALVQTPPSPEWSIGSLPVSPSSSVVGAQLELHRSILYDHAQCLDALPPTLFADIDRDVRELYTRSGAVRDEIFLQRYRFRNLEREQERATVTFRALRRPVLALEWAWHVDTEMADMSRAGYDNHRLIHDMLMQQAAMQRELQEIRGHVTALEQERGVESHRLVRILYTTKPCSFG